MRPIYPRPPSLRRHCRNPENVDPLSQSLLCGFTCPSSLLLIGCDAPRSNADRNREKQVRVVIKNGTHLPKFVESSVLNSLMHQEYETSLKSGTWSLSYEWTRTLKLKATPTTTASQFQFDAQSLQRGIVMSSFASTSRSEKIAIFANVISKSVSDVRPEFSDDALGRAAVARV